MLQNETQFLIIQTILNSGIQISRAISVRQHDLPQRHRLDRGSRPVRLRAKRSAGLSAKELFLTGHQQHGRLHHWMGQN